MSEQKEPDKSQVLKEITSGLVHPCYLFWGEDTFRLKETLKSIIDLLVPPADRDFLLFSFDGKEVRTGEILAALKTPPLLSGRKLVVVTDTSLLGSREDPSTDRLLDTPSPAAEAEDSQELVDFFSKVPPEETHLFLTARTVDRRRRLYKIMAEKGRIVSFPLEKQPARQLSCLKEALRETLMRAGKEMEPQAWELLGERVGYDPLKGRQEVAKLANYVPGPMISARDVEELIKDEQDVGLFDLIEALWGKKTDRALIVLARLLLQMNPVQILSHLARETRLLLQAGKIAPALTAAGLTLREYPRFQAQVYPVIKAWEPAKTRGAAFLLSQHPYVIYNCLRNAPRFSPEKLITLLKALQEMDVAMKTGSLDPGLLLENFIVLAGLPESPAAAP